MKLRGAARKAAKKMVRGVRSKHSDEAIRLVLLDWMDETRANEEAAIERGRKLREQIQTRQRAIEAAKANRKVDYKKVQQRRAEVQPVAASHIVPPCVDLSRPVRFHGNAQGCGASYRIVDGVAQRIS